jgi:glutathione S-transferase
MSTPYRLYGAELSPYSVKVRSYLRYKGLAHEWISRSAARNAEFAKYAKLPLIPALVDADETVLQDSTPMLEALEQRHPDPSIRPDEPAAAFLSALLEDYADEWLNKAMFHYRWTYEADQLSAAKRIVDMMIEGQEIDDRRPLEAQVRERMTGRLWHVGSSAETAPVIEGSFRRFVALLEQHLRGRPYLFGGRPSLADFGVAGQLYELLSDSTPGGVIRAHEPHVVDYVERMLEPAAQGPFEPLSALAPTLAPILREEIAAIYLPWMDANSKAGRAGEERFSVTLDGLAYAQAPQRYAGKALLEIRRKRDALMADEALGALLHETGCYELLILPPKPPSRGERPGRRDEAEERPETEDAAEG